jgi:hypothetical protein
VGKREENRRKKKERANLKGEIEENRIEKW